ncbi:DUF3466 family protein [Omnitrophica bacterium]|nr:DUF3466 family protein [Candidatus Omnitrophota bacterium]
MKKKNPSAIFILLMAVFILVRSPSVFAVTYEITDLGWVYANDWWADLDINNSGQVAGTARTGINDYHAFVWDSTLGAQGLSTAVASNRSHSYGINLGGDVVGKDDVVRANFWDDYGTDGQPLATSGGRVIISEAFAVNDSGQSVGNVNLDGDGIYALIWDNKNAEGQKLGELSNLSEKPHSKAYDINNAGQAVGIAAAGTDPDIQPHHAFLWDKDDGMQDLGTLSDKPESHTSHALGINDLGQVVGTSQTDVGFFHAFLWDNGLMQDIGTLPGFDAAGLLTAGLDINNNRQVVGAAGLDSASSRGFLWEDDMIHDLNDLIDPNLGWLIEKASAVNDKGQIVGWGTYEGKKHGFLLTPPAFGTGGIPEPGTFFLLASGLLGFAFRRRNG